MRVAILAGGSGTRLRRAADDRPKPLVPVGEKPILWHVMRHYAVHGFRDFVVAVGHRGDEVRAYLEGGGGDIPPSWSVRAVPTGEHTATGGRLKRLARWLGDGTFMLTWCDGLADVDLEGLLDFHRAHGRLATVTAVHPPSRFGHLTLEGDRVRAFREKPSRVEAWINGAFFVLEPGVLEYVEGDATAWEREPLERLAADGELMAWRHEGFWQCKDTPAEQALLEEMWSTGRAPWVPVEV